MIDLDIFMWLPIPFSYYAKNVKGHCVYVDFWNLTNQTTNVYYNEFPISIWMGLMKDAVFSSDEEYDMCLKYLEEHYKGAFVTNWLRKFIRAGGERDSLKRKTNQEEKIAEVKEVILSDEEIMRFENEYQDLFKKKVCRFTLKAIQFYLKKAEKENCEKALLSFLQGFHVSGKETSQWEQIMNNESSSVQKLLEFHETYRESYLGFEIGDQLELFYAYRESPRAAKIISEVILNLLLRYGIWNGAFIAKGS